nr:retrovirus-related Pol polyprotein from transposon TNT 1-94 [Tanacetum cinerariifolium]
MSASNADQMWNTLARVIQDATKDSLGMASESTKTHSTHMESWWFSEEVQTKVAVKLSGFKELLSCRAGNHEDIDMAKERSYNNHNREPPPQNGPPPMVRPNRQASQTMEELCQPSINGRGRPITSIPIQATYFGLRHHMIHQVQNTCQFHGLPGDDANRHIDKFLEITQHMKQNGVTDDALHLSLFPYSLTHHAIAWYDRLPRNSIHSFDDIMRKFLLKYFPPSMVTKLRNEITKFEQKPHESLFEAWERYKLSYDRCPNHNMLLITQIDTFYNGLTLSHRDTINATAGGTFMQKTPEECYELIENVSRVLIKVIMWYQEPRSYNNHNREPPPQNGPPPMVRPNRQASRTMEELCQPSINGRGRPIAPIPIQATYFGLRHHMIQQVQNTCQFHGLPGDDANRYIDKFLEITQHMKQNGVSDDALRLSLFPYSLTHHAIAWYDHLPMNFIHSFDDIMRKFLLKYFPPSMVTKLRNEITKFEQKPHKSLFEAWERYKLSYDRCPNHNMLLVTQIDTFYNGLTLSHRDTINAAAGGTFMQKTPEECYELIENVSRVFIKVMVIKSGFENLPPMLNKENYVSWSSRLLQYAKSRPSGKLIHNSIINGPYVRRMIPEPGNLVMSSANDEGSDIGIQEKKAKLINEWESNLKFLNNLQPEWSRHVTIVHQTRDLHTTDYTQLYDFLKYNQKEVDDLKAKRLARTQDPLSLMATSNNPYTFPVLYQDQSSFNQNYMQQRMPNPKDITDPTTVMNMALALMAKAFKLNYSTPTKNNKRISSNPRNRKIAQPRMNIGQDRQMQMVRGNGGNQFRQYAGQNNVGNQNGLIGVQGNVNQNPNGNGNLVAARVEGNATGHNGNQIRCYNHRGVGHFARNCTVRPRRRDAAYLQTQLLIAQKEKAGIQLQAEEFDLMAAAANLDEIEKVNANCILMANLQQASTSGTQTDKAPIYDSEGPAEVIQICLWCVDSGCFKHMTGNLKLLINFVWKFLGTVRFGNDHVAAILDFSDLQWGNILITRVYFVEGLGHNLFSVGQFCDSDLEVAFRRNACFIRNIEGVDLLKGGRTINLYTINLHEMASTSPIYLMARASSTKSWLWHQRLSHLNFDNINALAKNDLVSGLLKFKYHKEHLCPSCEQEKSKRASHPPKPVPNSRQRLHLLYMDLYGPIRIASINGKRYILVIMDDYSRYTWVDFLRSKDETPEVIKTFLKRITVLLQNRTLVEAARTMLIFSRALLFLWAEVIATACFTQNRFIIHRRFNKTPYELINERKPDISFLHVFGALCYPKNDREDIRKLGIKGDIGFFIGYSADSCAFRVSGLDLTYAPSTITTQQPTEGELDLLFEAMYGDFIGGQPSATPRTIPAAHAHQDVDELNSQEQHAQQLGNLVPIQPETVSDNVPNTMFDANTLVNPFATSSTSAAESSSS